MIDNLIAYGQRNSGHLSAAVGVLLTAAFLNVATGNADPDIIKALNRGDVAKAKSLVCEDSSNLNARPAMSEFSNADFVLIAAETTLAGAEFIAAARRDIDVACGRSQELQPDSASPKLANNSRSAGLTPVR